MKKYRQLFQDYKDTLLHIAEGRRKIAEIEHQAAEHEARAERLYELGRHGEAEREEVEAYALNAEEAEPLRAEVAEFMQYLSLEIRDEYAGCPFAATRRQGIDGFWRLAAAILNGG